MKKMIDTEALVQQFTEASGKHGEAVQKAVREATLKALQSRELTLKSVKDVLKGVAQAASKAAAQSERRPADLEPLLMKAVQGMDDALVQVVEANRRTLQQFVEQGIELRETHLKKAMTDIDKMEDTFYSTVHKAVAGAGGSLQGLWTSALEAFKVKGSATGASASAAMQEITARAQEASQAGRAFGQRGAEAWLDHFNTLASGVLIGMSEAMGRGAASGQARAHARRRPERPALPSARQAQCQALESVFPPSPRSDGRK